MPSVAVDNVAFDNGTIAAYRFIMQRNEDIAMPRHPSHESEEGGRWFGLLRHAQTKVERAERERDQLARDAAQHGLSARSLGEALNIDPATAWRRYARRSAT